MPDKSAAMRRPGRKSLLCRLTPYYFLIPMLCMALAFLVYPILNVFYYSFQHYHPAKADQNGSAGIDNYVKLFTEDTVFWQALWTSLKWVLLVVGFQLLLGLLFALLLNTRFRFRGLARAAIIAPWALSGVMIAILWSLIFNQHIGVLNDLLGRVGLLSEPVAWTANPDTAFLSVVIAEVWGGVPFFTISLLAQLQSIPPELYESCAIDGGSGWGKFRFITLPHLRDTIVLTSLLRGVWEFNAVDIILNLTGGGPINLTTTLSIYLTNQAIKARNFGYGSAIGVLTFFIMLAFSIVYLKLFRYEEEG